MYHAHVMHEMSNMHDSAQLSSGILYSQVLAWVQHFFSRCLHMSAINITKSGRAANSLYLLVLVCKHDQNHSLTLEGNESK